MTSSSIRTLVSATIGIACAVFLAGSAQAANLTCYVISVGVIGPFGGQIQYQALVGNRLSYTIPAGTVYTYVIDGRQATYRSTAPLAPGGGLSISVRAGSPDGPCQASVPGGRRVETIGPLHDLVMGQ